MIKDIDILYERDEKGDVKRRNILLAAIEEFLLEKWTHLSCHFFPFNKSDRPLPHAVRSRLINDESKKHGEEPRSIKRNWEGSHAALRMAPLFPRVHHLSRKSPLDKQSNETKLLFLVATASDASLLCDQVRRRSFFFYSLLSVSASNKTSWRVALNSFCFETRLNRFANATAT